MVRSTLQWFCFLEPARQPEHPVQDPRLMLGLDSTHMGGILLINPHPTETFQPHPVSLHIVIPTIGNDLSRHLRAKLIRVSTHSELSLCKSSDPPFKVLHAEHWAVKLMQFIKVPVNCRQQLLGLCRKAIRFQAPEIPRATAQRAGKSCCELCAL